MFDHEQQLKWAGQADAIVAEAAKQEGVELPSLLADAIAQAVRTHYLSQSGVFAIVAAYADSERQAGRLAIKPETNWDLKD